MKAGIVTFYHNNLNYGALLQAYALKNTIEQLGYETAVVDYQYKQSQPRYQKLSFSLKYLFYPRKLARYILYLSILQKKEDRVKKTENFVKKNLNLTSACCTSKEIDNLNLDVHICGSDQIWNPEITNGLKVAFFGGEGKAYKISYAASAGELDKLKKYKGEFVKLLNRMDAISVREYGLFNYIKTNTNYNVTHVLDPSLLLHREDYEIILKQPGKVKPYLLIYSLERDIRMSKLAHFIAKDRGLQVIEIANSKTPFCGHKQIFSADPTEFLGWIDQASFVVTNSFHGTAFSIVFRKNFFVIKHETRGARIESLLDGLKLRDRLVENPNDFKYTNIPDIVYQNVDDLLGELRKTSLGFIRNTLSFNA